VEGSGTDAGTKNRPYGEAFAVNQPSLIGVETPVVRLTKSTELVLEMEA
jgi:hypothetical protein